MRITGAPPTTFMVGAGVLWGDLSDGRGLPGLLPRPAERIKMMQSSSHRMPETKDRLFKQKLFLTSLAATLPDFEEMLIDSDLASYGVFRCALRVKELFIWNADSAAANPNY